MQKPLSTADVPSQFLQAAFMVGHTPLRALKSDPRVSYSLYIPPQHYDTASIKKLPLLVWIHGTLRKMGTLYSNEMVSFATSTPCAILAPLYPSGLDGPNDLDSYKTLRSKSLSSDLAVLSILEEVAARWPGIETGKIFMMGFSGGGQFAQRFLYLYPEKLLAVSIGAPGRTTMLDPDKPWPEGIANVEELFGRPVSTKPIQQVPIQLAVGSEDNQIHGSEEFWNWVGKLTRGQKSGDLSAMRQGRLQTLQESQTAWEADGIKSQLAVVDGASHEADKVRPHMLQFLEPLIQEEFRKGDTC
ncbi:hypothetical protein ASPVEDRAFT_882477 [Aspergillus versicolor CBS 583.65]|uniref:Carboxylic ester hydrolase n=1 Tax=Aspergillus versicolor CBS 583.65 TaxID=1036611 RepID=A0A1L9PCN9_ASPVE|nr:uncharacterized protein ASPVEDRAFT_882477 [Aspergillus versicolor CBS 583.65]OJI99242.1 hypothetical protein ASPVEDRAFT_882477 [Aspergillus versicolor CBS 583.65]